MMRTDEILYLAIDQGGHASRSIVFNSHGQPEVEAFCNVSTQHPHQDHVEHAAEEMLQSILVTLDKVSKQLGTRTQAIKAAGLATQRSSIVCWDRLTGQPLSPIISWQDRRAHSWLEQFGSHRHQIHQTTGLYLSAHYGVSKLRWCLDNIPEVANAYENGCLAWGPMASFLLFRLLDERPMLIDPANASRTLLLDLKRMDWDPLLLRLFDIPASPLPRCVPSCFHYGSLPLGDYSVPLMVSTGDQSATLYAFGHPESESAYINMGTGSFVQCLTGTQAIDAPGLLSSIILDDGTEQHFVLEGTVNGSGSALAQIENELAIDPEEAEALFPQWLEKSVNPPLFLNGISGLGAPFWVPNFNSHFIGESNPQEKIVAVAESILFLLQVNLNEMQKHRPALKNILATGGLAQVDALCQRLSDLSGLPLYRPAEAEATARGTAFLLAGCPADWPEQQAGRHFSPGENPALRLRFDKWQQAMKEELKKYAG